MSSGALKMMETFCDLDIAEEEIDCFFIWNPALLEGIRSPICRARQVHGKELLQVRSELKDPLSGTDFIHFPYDGLMTNEPGLVMTVYTADCLPILLYDPEKRVVASIHAGWRGTLLNISGAGIAEMVNRFQCNPSQIRVVSGPAIHACCFEIKEDVAALFRQADQEWGEQIVRSKDKMRLDLHEINRRQMLKQGVSGHHIVWNDACTFCHGDELPSFRRETGGSRRIISGIGLKNDGRK